MTELIKADNAACFSCAARSFTTDGYVCQPSRLGQSNKIQGKHRRFVFGRNHTSGTTLRPSSCPHPENVVKTTSDAQIMLRKKLGR